MDLELSPPQSACSTWMGNPRQGLLPSPRILRREPQASRAFLLPATVSWPGEATGSGFGGSARHRG